MRLVLAALILVGLTGCASAPVTETSSATPVPSQQATLEAAPEAESSTEPEATAEPQPDDSATAEESETSEPTETAKPSATPKPSASATKTATPSAEPTTEASAGPKTFTTQEVAAKNSRSACWVIVNGSVYDLTGWITKHPGGSGTILDLCGKDGTAAFDSKHGGEARPSSVLDSYYLGQLTN